MRIGVVGAGGVGGLVAGLLAHAGCDVVLVARGRTLDAIVANGLRVASPLGDFTARVTAVREPREAAPVDACLVTVKTWQVAEVASTLAPMLAPNAIVVPLQNGVDAPDHLVTALGASRVVGGLCHMLSAMESPGAITHVGAAPRFTFGAWDAPIDGRTEALKTALERAGGVVRLVDDFPAALWEKFLFIASFGGVGAITRSTAAEIRSVPSTRRMLADACEEVHAVARAKNVALSDDVVARTLAFVDGLPEGATASLQRDVVAGRPSEIESLSAAVARIGAELGVDVPVHRAIAAAIAPMEIRARAVSTLVR
jgi:2-dehydropantoate 2-reductase